MYTDEDLYLAVKEGIFEEEAVDAFRRYITADAHTSVVDEENFRLISGFNDIFVSVASIILLISAGWMFWQAAPAMGFLVSAVLAWLLSLFFVNKKKLALPAILFLVTFVASVVCGSVVILGMWGVEVGNGIIVSCGLGALAAWAHWKEFHVPVTVAAGVASVTACLLVFTAQSDALTGYFNVIACGLGVLTFLLAMSWDARDTARKTRKSDVAFWLHLLAAPLIVHPIFSALGILKGDNGLLGIAVVILTYVLLAAVSIAIDRRALMVSSLVYVLYAFRELFVSYGMVSSSLAISGIVIGSVLLMLSAFWHRSRAGLLRALPGSVTKYLPEIS